MKGYWQAMETSKCSVLVTSCDKYEDAWKPFFALFHIMWPDCPYPLYLNTETKEYRSGSVPVTALHPYSLTDKKGKEISWSKRLKDALEQIDSEYILFFLEDFFLMSPVRSDVVDECIAWMERDDKLGVVDFFHEPYEADGAVGEFSPIDRQYEYCVNAMSALWRKSFLLNIIREDENPWDFEFNGTYRFRRTGMMIYTHRRECPPVFDYPNVPKYGYGIFQGKWLWNNQALFEKYGIETDFSKRETLQYEDLPPLEPTAHGKHRLLDDLKECLKHPKMIGHYGSCMIAVFKHQLKKFNARWFHR